METDEDISDQDWNREHYPIDSHSDNHHFQPIDCHDELQAGFGHQDSIHALYDHVNVVGTPHEDANFFHHQREAFTCAVQAQAGIIHEFTGDSLTEGHLAVEAAERGWLSTDGMRPECVGQLLTLHGVDCHTMEHAEIRDLFHELSLGHKVIVGVNAESLWDKNHPLHTFTEQAANHAIWVTGFDLSDKDHPKVIINDSGKPDGAGNEYELNEFLHAWHASGYNYVATDHAPPHLQQRVAGYDEEHGMFTDLFNYLDHHIPEFGISASAVAAGIVAGLGGKKKHALIQQTSNKTIPKLEVQRESPLPSLSREELDRLLKDL